MALIPILVLEILNIVTYKSVDMEKIKVIMIIIIMHTHRCKQKQTQILENRTCWPQSKSGRPIRPYSTSSILFLLIIQQTCQNIARISSISLVH